ncbi:hypothetical protein MLD38_008607 [Melastoma candidum]|uniref:Uncharacterized protein n=1 Tax=Melastoma candidum TaxID=119954 RepID=A0ACB9RXY6_9MYRT|nr:hypothetical protein MLD38_008607 [Melastoma candidum]
MGASESRMFAEYLEKERAKSRLVKMISEESESDDCDRAVVVVSYRGRSRDLVLEHATMVARRFSWALVNYDEISPLVPTTDGRLPFGYGVLQRVAARQVSLGRGAVLFSPVLSGFRAYLDELRDMAHEAGLTLAVIEFWTGVEHEAENLEYPEDIPQMVVDLRNSEHIRFKDYLLDFFNELDLSGDQQRDGSPTFRHFSHPHPLKLEDCPEPGEEDLCCSICLESIAGRYYVCSSCDYSLHESCTRLPQQLQLQFHTHPLKLVNQALRRPFRRFQDSNLRLKLREVSRDVCRICNGEITSKPSYECYQCYKLTVHHECAVTLKDTDHQCHPHKLEVNSLNLAVSPFQLKGIRIDSLSLEDSCRFDCYACGSQGDLIFYYCPECKFRFHVNCVKTLPSSVDRKCPHGKPLLLSMPPKDETNEYYCEVCARMRHPDYWIYYCARCEYEAHPHCVIPGISPYIHPKPEGGEGAEKAQSEDSNPDYRSENGLEDDSSVRGLNTGPGNEFMDFFRQQMGNAVGGMTATGADAEVGDWLSRHMAHIANETDRLGRL